jgi:gas vesicle protein
MPEEVASKGSSGVLYFLVGLGLGSLVSILFAPTSGSEAREYLSERVSELQERAATSFEESKETVAQKKQQITAAIDAGRKVYEQEVAKAKAAGTET